MGDNSTSTDRRVLRSRERLHEALLALLADQRLDDISVAKIVAKAGIGYATFHRHYSDKQGLWQAVTEQLIHEMITRIEPLLALREHRAAALEICNFVGARRPVYRILMAGGAADYTRSAMLAESLRLLGPPDGPSRSELPPTLGSHFGVNAIFAILAWWLDGHDDLPAERIAGFLDRLVFAPLLGESTPEFVDGAPSAADPSQPASSSSE